MTLFGSMMAARRPWGRATAAAVLVAGVTGMAATAGAGAATVAGPPPSRAPVTVPTPTPARSGRPTSMAVLGDSISQGTGTGELSKENPKNSWAIGSAINSVRNRLGISDAAAYDLAANGDQMHDMDDQVNNGKGGTPGGTPLPSTTQYVVVELGGNDLCRDTVAAMTSVADYRTQLDQGLAAIKARAPQALVFLQSVPDIYNLWYIRGAPHDAVHHPEPESDQSAGYNGARFYWGQSFFPCHSLLDNPASYAALDEARRQQVRERDKAYNQVLAQECAKEIRCRFDSNGLFDMTSNRVSPPDGPLLPYNQWRFTDLDISRNEGIGTTICPVQGVFAGGCGDHFHPTIQGQLKLADNATNQSYQWSDTTLPTVAIVPTAAPWKGGAYRGHLVVRFLGSDNVGLRGQEVRVHNPDGSTTPWTPYVGVAPDLTLTTTGTSYVEARSIDVNGNQSASVILPVVLVPAVGPSAPPAPSLARSAGHLVLSWAAPADDGGDPVSGYKVTAMLDAGTTVGPEQTVGPGVQSLVVSGTPANHVVRYRVTASNGIGAGPGSPASPPTVAPFGDLAGFVNRQYSDFAGRAPTAAELAQATTALDKALQLPAAQIDALLQAPYWSGVIAPISRLYRAYFLRSADQGGLDFWVAKRRSGTPFIAVSQDFALSSEFIHTYGNLDDAGFVWRVYQNVLNRYPDAQGQAFWVAKLRSGTTRGQVMASFAESHEYQVATADHTAVLLVYRGMLGRVPRTDELSLLMYQVHTKGIEDLIASVLAGAEYTARLH